MQLVKTPSVLRKSAFLVWIAPLVVALQTMLYRNLPWWKLEWSYFELSVPIATAVSFIFWVLLVRGTPGSRLIVVFTSVLWVIASTLLAFYRDSVLLGFVSLALGIFTFFYADLLKSVFQLPYLNSGMSWYQSLPEPIPGLSADLKFGDEIKKGYMMSRLSTDGGFVVSPKSGFGRKKSPSELTLHYKGRKITCPIQIISRMPENKSSESRGLGVQFKNQGNDFMKDLADFVELLRGEGHVS